MPVTLLERIEGEQKTTKGRVFRENLNLEVLSPLTVSENDAEIRGSVSSFFPPAFADDSVDVYFSFKEVGSDDNPTSIFVDTFSTIQNDNVVTAEVSGLTRNTTYEYFLYGEIDGARVTSGNPQRFRTGVFSIETVEVNSIGQEEATFVGVLDKFRSLIFEQSGPFNITSEAGSGVVTYENVEQSESPLFVLDAFTNADLRTVINTDDGELTLENDDNDFSFVVSDNVTITVEDSVGFDLSPEAFSFQFQITRDINAGFEYKKASESSFKTANSLDSPEEAGDQFEATVSLDPNSNYEFRAFGTIGSFERVYGDVISFSTLEKEIVELDTADATGVAVTDATLNGSINEIQPTGRQVSVGFRYGSGSVTDNTTSLTPVTSLQDFSVDVSGLDADTTYEFQAYAVGQTGATYTGPTKTFETEGVIVETVDQPSAADAPSKQPTEGTGFLFGNIVDLNPDSASANAEFEYGKEKPLQTVKDAGVRTDDEGTFDEVVEGLEAGVEYKYRVQATDPSSGAGDAGTIKTFNTVDLDVDTLPADSIGQTEATINGDVTTLQTSGDYIVYFEYKKEGDSSFTKTAEQTITSGKASFSETLTGLQEAGVYSFRAVIEKNTATVKGDLRTFQTKGVEISTLAATNVQAGSADLNGELTFISSQVGDVAVYFDYREQGNTNSIRTFSDQSPVSSAVQFSKNVSGLDPAKTYEFRAGANPDGAQPQAGAFQTFTTNDLKVSTANVPSSRSKTTVTIGGEVLVFGGDFSVQDIVVGHQFVRRGSGDITNGTRVESSASPVSSLTTFETKISGLNDDTKYDVRAFATVGGTTAFGKIQRVSTNLN